MLSNQEGEPNDARRESEAAPQCPSPRSSRIGVQTITVYRSYVVGQYVLHMLCRCCTCICRHVMCIVGRLHAGTHVCVTVLYAHRLTSDARALFVDVYSVLDRCLYMCGVCAMGVTALLVRLDRACVGLLGLRNVLCMCYAHLCIILL